MKWKKKQRQEETASLAVQVRDGTASALTGYPGYTGLESRGQMELYRNIRQAVPIIDAAVLKMIRLCSGVRVEAESSKAQKGLDEFLRDVNTGRGQRGLQSFLDSYLDAMLTYGRGVGEIVLDGKGRHIAALLSANPLHVGVKEGESPLDFCLCEGGTSGEVFPYQDLLLFTPFQPEVENPYGVSLLRSMPFLTEILLKIYQATGMNWERMGNVRFAVVCKPGEDEGDAQERCRLMAQEWSQAMASGRNGAVRDFVAVGDVEIRVIGADNQVLDSEVPVRQILEQLIARTGIPPFMLGLSWSTTERMSSQQADILTSELTSIRRTLDSAIRRVCRLWLQLEGYGGDVEIHWQEINLQDEVEEAKADLYRAQAEEKRLAFGQAGALAQEQA